VVHAVVAPLACLLVSAIALASCGGSSDIGRESPSTSGQSGSAATTYTAPAGWTATIPRRWQELPFETTSGEASSVGVQISNVPLPAPTIRPGYPIQVNSKDLPDDGIALIIATDEDANVQHPGSLSNPPLDLRMFTFGSAPAGAPTLNTLWFSANGKPYLASIRTGPDVGNDDEAALREIIASLRFGED
jgi:hypothetical protein